MTSYHFSTDYGVYHIVWESKDVSIVLIALAFLITVVLGWYIWTHIEQVKT